MNAVRLSGVVVLVLAAGCGRFGFDPVIDATSDAPAIPVVQSGATRLLTGSSTAEAAIMPVAIEHSLLTFSLSVAYSTPDDIKLTARFIAADRIVFTRQGTERGIDIRWSVVTWERMTVRRGMENFAGTQQVTVVVDPPVDVARSFAIGRHRDPGSDFGDDEYVEMQLVAPDQLFARSRVPNSVSPMFEWQVAELDEGVVHHGTATLPPVTTLTTVMTPAFDPTRTWLLYSHSASGNAPIEAQHQTVSGRIVDGTQIAFERGGGAGTAHISWSLVELAAGTVEHGETTFPDGTTMLSAPITPVDPTRSFVFGGSFAGTSGRTTSIDPGPGPAWVAAELTDQQLNLRRGISTGTTISPWSVITLE